MGAIEALDRYRRYLEPLDREATQVADEEAYLDLMSDGEIIDLLCTRDELEQMHLAPEQRDYLTRLDDLLVKHHRVIAENLWPFPEKPRSQWWWHLHDGPQVRGPA